MVEVRLVSQLQDKLHVSRSANARSTAVIARTSKGEGGERWLKEGAFGSDVAWKNEWEWESRCLHRFWIGCKEGVLSFLQAWTSGLRDPRSRIARRYNSVNASVVPQTYGEGRGLCPTRFTCSLQLACLLYVARDIHCRIRVESRSMEPEDGLSQISSFRM